MLTNDQTYESAFESALKEEEVISEGQVSDFAAETDSVAGAKADPAVVEPSVEVEVKGEPAVVESVVEPQAEPVVVEPVVEAKVGQVVDTVSRADFDRLQAELAALRTAKEAPKAVEEEVQTTPPPPDVNTFFNADEQAVLKQYDEDWGDVAKAEALHRKYDIAVLRDEIYREVAAALGSVISQVRPLAASAVQSEEEEEEKHFSAIAAAHTDYENVLKNITPWVEQQPAYMKVAFNNVLQTGSAEEVIDLFSRFKTATGCTVPQVTQAAPVVREVKKDVVDTSNVLDLVPVTGGRGQNVSGRIDPSDFGGAWDMAAKSA